MKEGKSFSAQVTTGSEKALREFVEAAIREQASQSGELKSKIQDHEFLSRLTARLCKWLKEEKRVTFESEKADELKGPSSSTPSPRWSIVGVPEEAGDEYDDDDDDEDEEVMVMDDEEEDSKKCWGGRRGW